MYAVHKGYEGLTAKVRNRAARTFYTPVVRFQYTHKPLLTTQNFTAYDDVRLYLPFVTLYIYIYIYIYIDFYTFPAFYTTGLRLTVASQVVDCKLKCKYKISLVIFNDTVPYAYFICNKPSTVGGPPKSTAIRLLLLRANMTCSRATFTFVTFLYSC